MGLEMIFTCGCTELSPKTGRRYPRRISISIGPYFSTCKADNIRAVKEGVSKGNYGEWAKKMVEKYPDCTTSAYPELYVCECGFWDRYDKLNIVCEVNGKKKVFERFEFCPECGRKMHIAFSGKSGNEKLICRDCGKPMVYMIPIFCD